jgi:hypothetical protein
MSSERIIGEFYAALPLGSGGKPHNARRDSIDDAWQLRLPPDVELHPSVQATVSHRLHNVAAEIKSKTQCPILTSIKDASIL